MGRAAAQQEEQELKDPLEGPPEYRRMNWNEMNAALAKVRPAGGRPPEMPQYLIIRGTVSRVDVSPPGVSVLTAWQMRSEVCLNWKLRTNLAGCCCDVDPFFAYRESFSLSEAVSAQTLLPLTDARKKAFGLFSWNLQLWVSFESSF